jgi:phage portal protein BeeE
LQQQYYQQCLQTHIEAIETLLDEGLGLTVDTAQRYGTEFDLDDLLRMDTETKVKTAADSVGAGFLSPNEARARFNLGPTSGGESPYLQQQNYSLSALAKRDAQADPFAPATPALPSPSANDDDPVAEDEDEEDEVNVDRVLRFATY